MAHRFFVPAASIVGDKVAFDAAVAHQLRNVLRLRPGARVIVLDNAGAEYEVVLEMVERDAATGRIAGRHAAAGEPRLALTLYQGLIKSAHLEWLLQKGTELGVTRFVPTYSQRTVAGGARPGEAKRVRWERILREAAEQSHRGRLPALAAPMAFADACRESVRAHDLAILPWEEQAEDGLAGVLRGRPAPPGSVALLIGPEGGFTSDEARLARTSGVRVVTLGPRILRAETAGLVAASIVLYEVGELD